LGFRYRALRVTDETWPLQKPMRPTDCQRTKAVRYRRWKLISSRLTFIDLGNELGISLVGLNLASDADYVFAKLFISLMPKLDLGT